jgi:hypothetical protein
MKKHLLFVALLFAAVCVNAQVKWNAVDLNLAADEVAFKGVENGGPETINLEGISIVLEGQTNWLYKAVTTDPSTFTYNGNTYSQVQVQGGTNGMEGFITHSTGPSSAIHFVPTVSGTLDVAFKFGYNKKFYIAALTQEDLDEADFSVDMKAYAYDTLKYWGHFIDASTYEYYIPAVGADGKAVPRADVAESPHFTGATINVEAGKEYYLWFAGSKIMFCGMTFTPAAVVVEPATVKFTIDDTANKTAKEFKLRGSWNTATGAYDATWSGGVDHTVLYDDGTHGDVTAGDHIWSVDVSLIPDAAVTFKWGFMQDGTWGVVGPDREFTLADATARTETYVIPKKVGVRNISSTATVVKTEYYNLLGNKIAQPARGVNIIRKTMSDGSIATSKAVFNR